MTEAEAVEILRATIRGKRSERFDEAATLIYGEHHRKTPLSLKAPKRVKA